MAKNFSDCLSIYQSKVHPSVQKLAKDLLQDTYYSELGNYLLKEIKMTNQQTVLFHLLTTRSFVDEQLNWEKNYLSILQYKNFDLIEWPKIIQQNLQTKLPASDETWLSFVTNTYRRFSKLRDEEKKTEKYFPLQSAYHQWQKLVQLFICTTVTPIKEIESSKVLKMFVSK